MISALPNDAFTAFYQIRQLEMTAEGWVWLTSIKVTAASLINESAPQQALDEMVGLSVKSGSGPKHLELLV